MKQVFVVLSLLISIAFAQAPGYGISKSTWGSSDPQKCASWFAKYLPATFQQDSCPNGICECAVQGRYELETITSQMMSFGLHTINCTQHPYGAYSLEDVEKKFAREWGDFTKFHPLMDYNAGFWTENLDEYIEKFQKDNVPMTTLRWNSDDGEQYYSIIVNPCGFVVLELMGDAVSDKYHDLFEVHAHMRFNFKQRNNMPASSGRRNLQRSNHGFHHPGRGTRGPPGRGGGSTTASASKVLTPLKISRATKSIVELRKFYSSAIGATELYSYEYKDGSKHAVYMFDVPSDVGIQIHFWQDKLSDRQIINQKNNGLDPILEAHIQETGDFNVDDMEWTVSHFEQFLMKTHRENIKSEICGFNQWIDNHYAYDGAHGQTSKYLDDFAKHFKALDLPYRWFGGGRPHIYGVDPTGWGIQFDGIAKNPPSNAPGYKATCQSDDGCAGQGNCSAFSFMKFIQ